MADLLSALLELIQSIQNLAFVWRKLTRLLASFSFFAKRHLPSRPLSFPPVPSPQQRPRSRSEQSRRARHLAMEKTMVQLAGSGTAAKALFRSLVQQYPGKSADWYYSEALKILKKREQEAAKAKKATQARRSQAQAAKAQAQSRAADRSSNFPKPSQPTPPTQSTQPITSPVHFSSSTSYLVPKLQTLPTLQRARYLNLEAQTLQLATSPEEAQALVASLLAQYPQASLDWLYAEIIQTLKKQIPKSQDSSSPSSNNHSEASQPQSLTESHTPSTQADLSHPSAPSQPTPPTPPIQSPPSPPSAAPQPQTLVIPDTVPASLQIPSNPKPPQPLKTHYLFFKIVSLTKDEKTAERLLAAVMERYPEKDLKWQHEKVIFDLERDRR